MIGGPSGQLTREFQGAREASARQLEKLQRRCKDSASSAVDSGSPQPLEPPLCVPPLTLEP